MILESQDERSPTGFPEGNYLPATQLLNEGPQSIDLENHSAGAATQRFSEASNSPTNFAWSAPLPNNSGVTGRFQSSSGEINRRNASALTYGKRKLDGIEISPDVVQLLFEQYVPCSLQTLREFADKYYEQVFHQLSSILTIFRPFKTTRKLLSIVSSFVLDHHCCVFSSIRFRPYSPSITRHICTSTSLVYFAVHAAKLSRYQSSMHSLRLAISKE